MDILTGVETHRSAMAWPDAMNVALFPVVIPGAAWLCGRYQHTV